MTPQPQPSHFESAGSHACSRCGEEKPLDQFDRWRRGNSSRANWYCDPCRKAQEQAWRARTGYKSTGATRKYRRDPEKLERDREASRRWKREHLGQPGRPKAA